MREEWVPDERKVKIIDRGCLGKNPAANASILDINCMAGSFPHGPRMSHYS